MPKRLTAEDIREAFILRIPYFRTEVSIYYAGVWQINGSILCRECDRSVARFNRRLEMRDASWVAVHDNMSVESEFRRQGVAWAHYRGCVSAYLEWGIERVEMYANQFGPSVWPQFGFTFSDDVEREQVKTCFEELVRAETGKSPELEADDLEAYNLVFLELGVQMAEGADDTLAALALKKTAESQESGALTYVLDLTNSEVLRFIQEVGLLSDRE